MSLLDAAGVINGDIWCNGAFDFESPLKDLLDTGDYTLEQLLAEDELLQELRGVHPQLTDFFSSEEAVSGLIQYIILPPPLPTKSTTMKRDSVDGCDDQNIPDKTAAAAEDDDHQSQSTEGKEQQATENDDGTAADSKTESNEIQEEKENSTVPTSKEPGKLLQGKDLPEEVDAQEPKLPYQEKDDLDIRFPYMACEVICCEIKEIVDILVDGTVPLLINDGDDDEGKDEAKKRKRPSSWLVSDDARGKPILDLFFSILYTSEIGKIDDYRAGYFEKVLSILFKYRPKDIAKYLNEGGGKGNVTLMSAMFKHLYSHSLMQIVQRLLLPRPPIPPPKPEGGDSDGKGESNECEDLFNDTLEGTELDPTDSFRCNWSESEIALQMVLDCLLGENSNKSTTNIQEEDDDDKEERKLDLYQNSSEVLITIVQNSPLTSLTMRTLTTDPCLGKLITAATIIEEGSEFSRHDSRLTSAMNVLESLILQLGGYGSVGTMTYEGEVQIAFESVMEELITEDHKQTSEDLGGRSQSSTTATSQHKALPSITAIKNYASPETLIQHLPIMLSSLSNLLVYPGAEKWKSPMQFSKMKAQNILGSSRLRIVRLLESLVLLGNRNIDSLLCESSCLEACLDLFWKFQWCSMLHQSVANLLVHAFEGQNSRSELQIYFIVRSNLLGRLMYSFWEKEVEGNITSIISASNIELSESVAGHKDSDSENSPTLSSLVSEKESGSSNDVLPVSDDDVDAAMEQQEDAASIQDSTENKKMENGSIGDHDDTKILSLRLGYMGHVIIICQALVHACAVETENNSPPVEDPNGLPGEMISEHGQLETHLGDRESLKPNEDLSYPDSYTSADDDTPAGELILARLVRKHPLGKIWRDFVSTTLASETALQTTPLGGFQAPTLGTDPLHMHRPGLEDDGAYDDDDGEALTMPQRGLLVDGDVIDMDDNDLEVAANMMAGLNLGQVAGNHGGSQTRLNPSHQSGYIFDDPLGGGRFEEFDDSDDGNSSSDEEPEMLEGTRGSGSAIMDGVLSEPEAPVMDQSTESWSDFANFDNAFADTQAVDDIHQSEENKKFDSVFGDVKSHDILLDELDKPLSHENDTHSIDVQATSDQP
jgi:hypothetical protein